MTDVTTSLVLVWHVVYSGSYRPNSEKTFADIKRRLRLHIKPELGAMVDDWVRDAQRRIEDKLRIGAMEHIKNDTIAEGNNIVPVPSDYLELIELYVVDNEQRVPLYDRHQIRKFLNTFPNVSTDNTGRPVVFARVGDKFQLDKYTDKEYEYGLAYYRRFITLIEDDNSNWWTEQRSDLLFYAALVEAIPFVGEDKRIPLWIAKKQELMDDIELQDKKERRAGNGNALNPINVFLSSNNRRS